MRRFDPELRSCIQKLSFTPLLHRNTYFNTYNIDYHCMVAGESLPLLRFLVILVDCRRRSIGAPVDSNLVD